MSGAGKWYLLAAMVAGGWLLYLLSPVLAPFLTAAAFAYLGDPLVDRLERRMSRTLAVVVVFAILFGTLAIALVLLVPLLQHQLTTFIGRLPLFLDWFETRVVPWSEQTLGIAPAAFDLTALKAYLAEHWQNAGGLAVTLFGGISRSGMALLGWVVNLLLVPVVTFYLLRDWDLLVARVHELIPRRAEAEAARLARAVDEVLGAFLRGQILVMLALGVVYSIGLWVVGLDLAFLIGMVAGLLSFVPYLGFIVGLLTASVAALMQFHEALPLLYVVVAFGVGQILEGAVLTPWLLGDRIGLHPVAVVFAVLAGGQLFGFTGVLLALPAAAVIMVLLRYGHERYLQSPLYGPPSEP